ncbi:hypothetical protein [Priestia megaterium]|uniref:hypothetical protein n=1 Tax=Priestia megaterium TaxID=1404 RepID=UPI0028778678|nr:hypothetical protein [Priestia megaterium]
MKLINKETQTINTYEMTQLEKLVMLGLINKVLAGEQVETDRALEEILKKIAASMSNI